MDGLHAPMARDSGAQALVMASVDSSGERAEAHADGWRSFRVLKVADAVEAKDSSEIACPASVEAGKKVTCEDCGLCKGTSRPARSIAIVDHSTRALAARKRLNVIQSRAA